MRLYQAQRPPRLPPSLRTPMLSAFVLAMGLEACPVIASVYDVTINTSSLGGNQSTLAFDFVAGGAFSNTVTISDFSTNGMLGVNGPNSGSVIGSLPGSVTLSDASFFNEFLQGTTVGSRISFQLDATTNGPSGGSFPDTFSFFILDSSASKSLLTTTDPTGADSLFTLQIDGSAAGVLGNYSAEPAVSATIVLAGAAVPEPDTLAMLIMGVLLAICRTARRTLRRSPNA